MSMILQFCLGATLFLATALAAGAAEVTSREDPGPGCCKHDPDIARWHKNADRLYAQFKAREAAAELQKILDVDGRNFEALVKIARAYIDIGDMILENDANWKERKLKEYTTAEDYARRAVKLNPNSTWGHFWVAAALGNSAIVSPIARQLELAGEIRAGIEKAIALDPKNGLAYHAYGVWHRKLAEIGGANRVLAPVLYGQSVPTGSLDKSVEYLKRAVELNPTIIVSRLELARSYVAKEEWEPARVLLRSISELPIRFSDDSKHKKQAAQLLAEVNDR
ncbi:MAG: tetratricopeptide repeat protein [Candidatus Binatia bacterium]